MNSKKEQQKKSSSRRRGTRDELEALRLIIEERPILRKRILPLLEAAKARHERREVEK